MRHGRGAGCSVRKLASSGCAGEAGRGAAAVHPRHVLPAQLPIYFLS